MPSPGKKLLTFRKEALMGNLTLTDVDQRRSQDKKPFEA
jgi:hypothetical protein